MSTANVLLFDNCTFAAYREGDEVWLEFGSEYSFELDKVIELVNFLISEGVVRGPSWKRGPSLTSFSAGPLQSVKQT